MTKIFRTFQCFCIKHFKFFHFVKKWKFRRFFHQRHVQQILKYASNVTMYRYNSSNLMKCQNYLINHLFKFIELARAHYNVQIDELYCNKMIDDFSDEPTSYYVMSNIQDALDIAVNYFIRNRARLIEWWCNFTEDGRHWFGEKNWIKIDLGYPFDQVFSEKCKNELGFEVHLDDNSIAHKYMRWMCLDIIGNPNAILMKNVQTKAKYDKISI